MDDLISRKALLDDLEYYISHSIQGSNSEYAYIRAKEKVEAAPAIDAVPVVRCKDCKRQRKEGSLRFGWCIKWGNVMADDDFCAYGVRRADNG